MRCRDVIALIKKQGDPRNVAGMARYGISTHNTYGVPIPALRGLAKTIGKDHALAAALWDTGVHEARILASLIAEPGLATDSLLEAWVTDFDSWDVCDQCCSNFIDKTPFAWEKAVAWSRRQETFVKRAGFVLMATLAAHDKASPDAAFKRCFPLIVRGARDERNFVKKAVNWALRQIGKRSRGLNTAAIACAQKLLTQAVTAKLPSARWIARDALRELLDPPPSVTARWKSKKH